ncbi:hypothetical protein OVA26_16665 [Microbacterium sp. SL62]|uniref:hypothetical protein n=1 Tax=Microbacterium sp. SL62 TaxID=2995139 RepID=UPI0022733576|nr:hypothetical protein [Microbacterium sp. SL62]MCY1718571.1 hypothetical protein [Microbacterium sp. SL62]
MSNFIASARTNRFRVRDIDALKADLATYGVEAATFDDVNRGAEFVLVDESEQYLAGSVSLYSFGAWPSFDEDGIAMRLDLDDETPVPDKFESLHALVASHLVDGEVAIFIEVGAEKMRYLGGVALAVNAAGETRRVDLDDIHGLAQQLTAADQSIWRADS